MEHQTYTLEGIKTAIILLDETRDKLIEETVEDQTHVLVEIGWFHEFLNDVEMAICGDLEIEEV